MTNCSAHKGFRNIQNKFDHLTSNSQHEAASMEQLTNLSSVALHQAITLEFVMCLNLSSDLVSQCFRSGFFLNINFGIGANGDTIYFVNTSFCALNQHYIRHMKFVKLVQVIDNCLEISWSE